MTTLKLENGRVSLDRSPDAYYVLQYAVIDLNSEVGSDPLVIHFLADHDLSAEELKQVVYKDYPDIYDKVIDEGSYYICAVYVEEA